VPWPHVSNGSSYAKLGRYTRWFWAVLFVLLPFILWHRKPLYREERLLMWLIFTWTAVQLGGLFVPGQSRYRLPFEALSLLLMSSVILRKRAFTGISEKNDLAHSLDRPGSQDPS
jgi:hypothetical protein